ncbi:hypothetical protein [Subtercola boreus]|uniref:Uncharacterized protein n=1 Tax=Subtercola boreus TaxID=120213 RepID=A0A3E0WCJ6_9MICO|nr:hypothetical protein [Subtercola boreus]RFA22514.1 hypothetical protein B7R24_02505 [Subtercola boreus]RFA22870.1 hypothetical protein B7R23_02500 [Subtercola boreus]RFA28622.1 hypothetical protein B7R25_02515 [Subtercola boreus]
METVQIIAVVAACLLGWIVISFAFALVVGRLIANAKREQRLEREWSRAHPAETFNHAGASLLDAPPERATLR